VRGGVGKGFFFEKKKQKTFVCWGMGACEAIAQTHGSFLVLFFKKEQLSL